MYRQRGGGGAGEECSDHGLGEGVGVLVSEYVGMSKYTSCTDRPRSTVLQCCPSTNPSLRHGGRCFTYLATSHLGVGRDPTTTTATTTTTTTTTDLGVGRDERLEAGEGRGQRELHLG